MPSPKVPKLFILGFTKCATSSLHQWLIHHPLIEGGVHKELEFLYDKSSYFYNKGKGYHDLGLDGYEGCFPNSGEGNILLDSTPAYVYHETALNVISQMAEKPICIFLKRDPVEQIVSTYHYFSNNKLYIPKDITLVRFLEMVLKDETKDYFEQDHLKNAREWADFDYWLKKWKQAIPEENILVFDMKETLKSPMSTIKPILDKLEIDDRAFEGYEFPGANQTYYVKSRPLQYINTLIRPLIPTGSLYNFLRAVYRKANGSTEKKKLSEEEQTTASQLRHIYSRL